jgi:6-phosphogluconolactonase
MAKIETIVAADAHDLAVRGAELFKAAAGANVDQRGRFVVALSGGSTPRRMHRLLASPPLLHEVPWEKTHFFWVDERCLPASDPESNLGTAWRDLLRHLPLTREHLHFVSRDFPPEEAVADYHEELTGFFELAEGEFPVFDLIFLGMGEDGHTASLFPGSNTLLEERRLVAAVKGGTPGVNRVTLTIPVLNRARRIIFLLTGREKAKAVQAVLRGDRPDLPAAQIKPLQGKVIWLLDQEAAALLEDSHAAVPTGEF